MSESWPTVTTLANVAVVNQGGCHTAGADAAAAVLLAALAAPPSHLAAAFSL